MWSETADRVAQVAGGLKEAGVRPGDRVAILARIFRGLLWVSGCRYAKVPVLQGIIGLLYGSISLTGRHFAGEEYRGRVAGESLG